MKLLLVRYSYQKNQTIGRLYLLSSDGFVINSWHTLELPWRDNQVRISCIPEMIVKCSKHNSPKFGKCLWLREVPNRSEILIHPANRVEELLGCIALGQDLGYLDKDRDIDILSSRKALKELLSYLDDIDSIMLEIKSNDSTTSKKL